MVPHLKAANYQTHFDLVGIFFQCGRLNITQNLDVLRRQIHIRQGTLWVAEQPVSKSDVCARFDEHV
jgi:hypothetical protein